MEPEYTKTNPSVNTKAFLGVLEKEFKKWTDIITNMKAKRLLEPNEYLAMCVKETASIIKPYIQHIEKKDNEEQRNKSTNSKLEENKDIESAELKGEIEKPKHQISMLEDDKKQIICSLKKDINDKTSLINELNTSLETKKTEIENLNKENSKLRTEREELQTRLSKLLSERIMLNNPAVMDLSDSNRPTKLAEMYLEIYDNEWTDAFASLCTSSYSDQEAIDILRLTLLHCFEFCKRKANELLVKTGDAIQFLFQEYQESFKEIKTPQFYHTVCVRQQTGLSEQKKNKITKEDVKLHKLLDKKTHGMVFIHTLWCPKDAHGNTDLQKEKVQDNEPAREHKVVQEELTHMRKEISTALVPLVQKAYINTCWKFSCIATLKPFIEKCLFVGWMMVIQSPPMCLYEAQVLPETPFDKNMFRAYTTAGPLVDYTVWPAMLLRESGPVVAKGVAQGKK